MKNTEYETKNVRVIVKPVGGSDFPLFSSESVVYHQESVMHIWRSIRSTFQRLHTELTRLLDHSWRRYWGLPLLRNSQITPQLFVGGQYTNRGFRRLQERGITAIVSMRSQLPIDPGKYPTVRFLHLPTRDRQPPTLEQLHLGSQFIQQQIDTGGKVYIHCLHGEGRGPSMAIAYLISTGLTLEDALALVKHARSFIQPTTAQIERLKEFEKVCDASLNR